MDTAEPLIIFEYGLEGFQDTLPPRAKQTTLAPGSRHLTFDLDNVPSPLKAPTHIGKGARVMALAGDSWAGLADTVEQPANGGIFSYLADMLIYCGYGQVVFDGAPIPNRFASSLVQILLRWQGSYTSENSGPFVAGLAPPGAPTVGVIETSVGGTPTTDGTYSFKAAWIRTTTFARSIASPASATLTLKGKGAFLQIGDAPEGATHLVVFVTKRNFGGRGLHYRLIRANPYTGLEYTASDIERELKDVIVANGSPVVSSPTVAFTDADVGKRFNPESAGFSVPDATVIKTVESPTSATLSHNVTVISGENPRTISIISYVAGLDRAVLLNWQEADLKDEIAWIEDYPPPPGSDVFPLEKVLGVISDADSYDLASGTNRGTTASFSLPNFQESFNPLHKLYLPQKVVSVLPRGLDSYVFVGCKNFIGAFQFIDVEGSAPATLTTILPNEGINSRSNWCVRAEGLYLFTNKGVAKRVEQNGQVDDGFSIPVRRIMKSWTEKEKVVVSSYGDRNSVAYIYKNICLLYNTQTRLWSAIYYFTDSHPLIECVAALDVDGKLLISAKDASISNALELFDFDSGAGGCVAAIPHYTSAPDGKRTKIVNYVAPEFNADTTKPIYLSFHINDETCFVTDAQIVANTDELNSQQAKFDESFVGKYVLVNGAGNFLLRARIVSIVSPSRVKLGTCARVLSNCAPQTAVHTVQNAYCVIAHRVYEYQSKIGTNRPEPKEIFENGIRSFAFGIIMESSGEEAAPLSCAVYGSVNAEKNWRSR